MEEGANEDVVELPLIDTHVTESEAQSSLQRQTSLLTISLMIWTTTTLQDPIQEVQQSVQIVQPPAAPSAHDIRQRMEALHRQAGGGALGK